MRLRAFEDAPRHQNSMTWSSPAVPGHLRTPMRRSMRLAIGLTKRAAILVCFLLCK
jgi:hypothetical protein